MRRFLCLALAVLCSLPFAHVSASETAMKAFAVLPRKYHDGVLKIIGRDSTPNPYSWTFIARNSYENDTYTCVEILDGQVIQERVLLNPFLLIGMSHLEMEKVKFDSNVAWRAARNFISSKGLELASVNYSLHQHGPDASPYWRVRCFDANGKSIGMIEMLATTGTILSAK